MNGDTQTQKYLNIAANGTRADLPEDTCCLTNTQRYVLDVAERLIANEEEIATKQDKLTAGENIEISEDNVISSTGGGGTLYDSLGENTDGAITQQTARRAIYGDSGRTKVVIRGQDASADLSATPNESVHVGYVATGNGTYGVAVGARSSAGSNSNTTRATSVGYSSRAQASYSVALGAGATTNEKGEINITTAQALANQDGYNNTRFRLIRGVYPGVQDNDAVNVAQLNAAIAALQTQIDAINGTGG